MINVKFWILCGGKGSRLFGIASESQPKPFVKLENGQTLLSITIGRIVKIYGQWPALISDAATAALLHKEINSELKYDGPLFLEQTPMGTTRAIADHIGKHQESNVVNCILPCDQIFDSDENFKRSCDKAIELASTSGSLVLIGAVPEGPNSQLGYFLPGKENTVLQFCEKPALEYSKKLISAGWLVNTGIFFGRSDWFAKNISQEAYKACGSFDRDVVSKSDDVKFVPANFRFFDVGTIKNFVDVFDRPAAWKWAPGTQKAIDSFESKLKNFWAGKSNASKPEAEFDEFVDNYREKQDGYLWLSGESSFYFAEYKALKASIWLTELINEKISILDFGCGDGVMTDQLSRFFPNAKIYGCDVSSKSIEISRQSFPNYTFFVLDQEKGLPVEQKYDLIVVAGVFHHIEFKKHNFWIKNIKNALSDDGKLLVFELNPLNPGTQIIFRRNPMEQNAKMLWPWYCKRLVKNNFKNCSTKFYSFFPSFLKGLRFCEPFLERVPLGALYACLAIKKK